MAEEKSRTSKNVVLRYNTRLVNLPLDVSRDVIPTDSLSRNDWNEWLIGWKRKYYQQKKPKFDPFALYFYFYSELSDPFL